MNDMKKFLEMSHIQLQRIPLAVKCGIAVAVCALFIVHWFLQEEALGYAYADAFCQSVTMTGADQHLDAYDAIMDWMPRVVERSFRKGVAVAFPEMALHFPPDTRPLDQVDCPTKRLWQLRLEFSGRNRLYLRVELSGLVDGEAVWEVHGFSYERHGGKWVCVKSPG